MIKNKDIIVVGIQAWDIPIGSNCKNIAIEFARNNRVLYVNSPVDRSSKSKEKDTEKIKKRIRIQKGIEPDLVEIGENMWTLYPKKMIESINWIKSDGVFSILNKRNAKRFASDISDAIERLGFKDFILFNDSSMYLGLYLKELLHPKMYVYYMRDYLIKNYYWKKHAPIVEPKLIKKADLVVNNSVLYAEYGAEHNKYSYMVGQGCDVSLFSDEKNEIKVPEDMKNIPKPIIGYVGYLTAGRLDIELIIHLAKGLPEWSVVLVGPEDDRFKGSELHQIKNVYFLGSRQPDELPGYIKGFDVTMNPQLLNYATMGNYPRKIDEYLAMGKPVLATSTKAMEYFKDYTYLGKTKEEYIVLAKKALAEDSEDLHKSRSKYAKTHSWENNVKEIYKYIELVAKEKNIALQ